MMMMMSVMLNGDENVDDDVGDYLDLKDDGCKTEVKNDGGDIAYIIGDIYHMYDEDDEDDGDDEDEDDDEDDEADDDGCRMKMEPRL